MPGRQPDFTGTRVALTVKDRIEGREREREGIVKVPRRPKEKPIQEVDALNGAFPKLVKVILAWRLLRPLCCEGNK